MSNDDKPPSDKSGIRPLEFLLANKKLAKENPQIIERLSWYHLIYSILGLLVGLSTVIGGIVLFLHGVAGSTSWTAEFLGAKSRVSDAAPGVVLFIVGLFIVLITRLKIEIR